MASLFGWLDERLDLTAARRALLDREVPDRLTWWHTLGSATLTVFVVQAITGTALATYYSPSPEHAYDSIRYLTVEVASGALLRGIHHWAASAMVILIVAHIIRVFTAGAYKYPREVNWALGVGLFMLVMAFSFTGYLLPWDQKAYWATAVGTNMAGTTPVIGAALVALLRGGAELGAATLARFYAFHVLWLPLVIGALIALHLVVVVRQGIASRSKDLEAGAPRRTDSPEYAEYYRRAYEGSKTRGVRFWPDIVGKDAVVSAGVVIVIVVFAALAGAPLEGRADPSDTSYVPRPEWYFLPIYQLLKLVPGSAESLIAVGIPTAFLLVMLALPFVDRGSARNIRRRPVAMVALVAVLGASGLLIGGAGKAPKQAVPVADLILNAGERAGRVLYQVQQCGMCHVIDGEGGSVGPDLSTIGRRHSAGWLHSFIETPSRFRPGTAMPAFGPPVLSHQEIEDLSQYLASLGRQGNSPQYIDTFPLPQAP